ncbi:MAG: tRNA threonylcarbamoyladenosine biosynthesis protein TsaB [bacterium ADurb.BinA186]|nr:MAG: tRNA threonylcarbamoyladenosine biosynthesis protein TsaB [bacterium ADurb.BinA186]
MIIHQETFLAFDTAFEQGRVVIFSRDGTILSECALDDKMSHSTSLCGAIERCLQAAPPLCAVMVGLGPGSFIGLRIALATALGYSFGRSLPLMGFSSHLALAHSTTEHQKLAVVTKASGNLVYTSTFLRNKLHIKPLTECAVLDKNETLAHLDHSFKSGRTKSDYLIISDVDLGGRALNVRGPTAEGVVDACLEKIALGIIDESTHIKPDYRKGPNVSIPKNSPICGQLLPSA